MSSRSSFSYSKPSLDVYFSVDGLNLDPDYVFGPDQDLFHHHVFRGEDTRASFTSHLSASLQTYATSNSNTEPCSYVILSSYLHLLILLLCFFLCGVFYV
ncbi:hypothetical protein P8452_30124 [Trifolium repens]|nr:hypothetical protein P8452_30124 [Trifolium repens]